MAKRFTATDKWDKEWFMSLSPKYKCLWVYINDKCDQAGMWQVNYKLASMHINEPITEKDLAVFGNRVEKFAPDKIWIVEHVDFQSGTLSEKCLAHKPIFKLLKKYNLLDRVLNRVCNTLKEKETEKEEDKEKEKESEKQIEKIPDELFSEYEKWTDQVVEKQDQFFEQMMIKEKIKPNGNLTNLARDHLGLLASYPRRRPPDQHKFRLSLLKHIRENITPQPNANRFTNTRTSSTIGSIIDPAKNYDE